MAELYPDNDELAALSGTIDPATGVRFPAIGENDWYYAFYKMLLRLLKIINPANALRVYRDGAATFGVRAARWVNGDTPVNYAGASGQALTDDATNYVYMLPDGTLTVNTTGFPTPSVTEHARLATIAVGSASAAGTSGLYADEDITDYRQTINFLS